MKKLTFITGNMGKVEEISRYFGFPVDHKSIELHEIQSLNPEEIVEDKAKRAYEEVGGPVLVEDVSLVFHSLGKLPGTFIKWFEQELGNDGLCRLVDGKDRSCTASVCYGFYNGEKVYLVHGSMEGSVSEKPKGENSFGWASIFIPKGFTKTYAELSLEDQSKIAMRKIALEKLKPIVEKNL